MDAKIKPSSYVTVVGKDAKITPAMFATMIPSSRAKVKPNMFATVISSSTAKITPTMFATVIPSNRAKVKPAIFATVTNRNSITVTPNAFATYCPNVDAGGVQETQDIKVIYEPYKKVVRTGINYAASIIRFSDGEDLQTKLEQKKLGSTRNAKDITTVSGNNVQDELDSLRSQVERLTVTIEQMTTANKNSTKS